DRAAQILKLHNHIVSIERHWNFDEECDSRRANGCRNARVRENSGDRGSVVEPVEVIPTDAIENPKLETRKVHTVGPIVVSEAHARNEVPGSFGGWNGNCRANRQISGNAKQKLGENAHVEQLE